MRAVKPTSRTLSGRLKTERDQVAIFERSPGWSSFIDVLDRVLDKGIVIDGRARVSLAGIDLVVDGWIVVAAIDTYLRYAQPLGLDAVLPDVRDTSGRQRGQALRS